MNIGREKRNHRRREGKDQEEFGLRMLKYLQLLKSECQFDLNALNECLAYGAGDDSIVSKLISFEKAHFLDPKNVTLANNKYSQRPINRARDMKKILVDAPKIENTTLQEIKDSFVQYIRCATLDKELGLNDAERQDIGYIFGALQNKGEYIGTALHIQFLKTMKAKGEGAHKNDEKDRYYSSRVFLLQYLLGLTKEEKDALDRTVPRSMCDNKVGPDNVTHDQDDESRYAVLEYIKTSKAGKLLEGLTTERERQLFNHIMTSKRYHEEIMEDLDNTVLNPNAKCFAEIASKESRDRKLILKEELTLKGLKDQEDQLRIKRNKFSSSECVSNDREVVRKRKRDANARRRQNKDAAARASAEVWNLSAKLRNGRKRTRSNSS